MKNINEWMYLICNDSGTIKAENGLTGEIDYIGKDASSIIQSAHDVMCDGQNLFIKWGIYDLTNPLNITKAINISGEGAHVRGWGPSDIGTVLRRQGNVLNYSYTNPYNRFPIIRDIVFDGINKSDTDGVLKLRGFYGDLYNVVVENGHYGINIANSWSANCFGIRAYYNDIGGIIQGNNINLFGCKFDINYDTGFIRDWGTQIGFYGCDFEFNGQYGLQIQSGYSTTVDGCYFETNPNYTNFIHNGWKAYSEGADIKIGTDVSNPYATKIANCYFGGMDTNTAITGAYRVWLRQGNITLIENSTFYQTPATPIRTDIRNDKGSNAGLLLINCINAHDGPNLNITGTAGIKAINTSGWKTNNILSDTFAIDSIGIKQIKIPHGLNIVPNAEHCVLTVVENTPVDDWYYSLLKVVSTDVTNVIIKINVSKASATIGSSARLALNVGY